MAIATKTLTDGEFKNAVSTISSIYDPDFHAFLRQLARERRLIVEGLTAAQMSFIRHKWPRAVHIKAHRLGGKKGVKLVYLQDAILVEEPE